MHNLLSFLKVLIFGASVGYPELIELAIQNNIMWGLFTISCFLQLHVGWWFRFKAFFDKTTVTFISTALILRRRTHAIASRRDHISCPFAYDHGSSARRSTAGSTRSVITSCTSNLCATGSNHLVCMYALPTLYGTEAKLSFHDVSQSQFFFLICNFHYTYEFLNQHGPSTLNVRNLLYLCL
jgi:hypothetical protein